MGPGYTYLRPVSKPGRPETFPNEPILKGNFKNVGKKNFLNAIRGSIETSRRTITLMYHQFGTVNLCTCTLSIWTLRWTGGQF